MCWGQFNAFFFSTHFTAIYIALLSKLRYIRSCGWVGFFCCCKATYIDDEIFRNLEESLMVLALYPSKFAK